ncbi:MAG: hypothetical protein HGB12_11720 [Bacteroidetes bacterium]|nr:hypothetical protein [Bacteroidota bacterium]
MTKKISFQIERSIMYVFFTFYFSLSAFHCSAQGVAINPTGTAADNSAMLDVSSSNQGILIPRVVLTSTTSASPITNPANKLMVYNTNTTLEGGNGSGIYIYDSTNATTGKWVYLTAPSNGPGTNGQVLTSGGAGATPTWTAPATYTAGTGLSLSSNTFNSVWTKTGNNIYKNNSGNVGIGTTAPSAKLQILLDGSPYLTTDSTSALSLFGGGNFRLNLGVQDQGVGWLQMRNWDNTAKNFVLNPLGGNVGIGLTNPYDLLTVIKPDGTGDPTFTIGNDQINKFGRISYSDGSDIFAIQGGAWGGTTRPLILQGGGGSVGIGTINPTAKLHVAGTSGVDGIKFPDGTLQTSAATGLNVYKSDGVTKLGPLAGVTGTACNNWIYWTGTGLYQLTTNDCTPYSSVTLYYRYANCSGTVYSDVSGTDGVVIFVRGSGTTYTDFGSQRTNGVCSNTYCNNCTKGNGSTLTSPCGPTGGPCVIK